MKNPLVERFKKARAEIRNLKTAHYRGLGLAEIYGYEYTFNPGRTGFVNGTITLTIDSNFAGYPFLHLLGYGVKTTGLSFVNSITVEGVEYSNNGYTVSVKVLAAYDNNDQVPNKYKVNSSSPITNVSYNWS